jgi:hypothetical protein
MRKFRILLLLLIAVQVPVASAADQPSLAFGGVTLTLGERRASALEKLAKERYELRAGGSVWDPNRKVFVGTIGFREERLALALRNWLPGGESESFDLARALYGAIRSLIAEGERNCRIATGESDSPEGSHRTVFFVCGNKRLEVTSSEARIQEYGLYRGATINEVIGDFLHEPTK